MYCKKCGKPIDDDAVICVHCGCQVRGIEVLSGKSWLITLLLCAFLGSVSAHRFYTGYIWIGILQIITFGGFGIWWLIDLIMILCRNYKTANGEYLIY